MSREQMLRAIRDGLSHTRPFLLDEAAKAAHEPPDFVLPPAEDLAIQFLSEVQKLEGHVYQVEDSEAALDQVAEILTDVGAKQALTWELDAIGLPGLAGVLKEQGIERLDMMVLQHAERQAQLQALEEAEIGISAVDVAIAESGTLVMLHGPNRPRLASLLAPTHLAIVRLSQIVRGLGEALTRLHQGYPNLFADTSNLTFITGPSRTADIEMTLTLGIHGPKALHVIVIND